jgi:hypothetical protein
MPRKLATPCSVRSCPNLKPCPDHMRQAERARGTRQQRGYTSRHDSLRANWKPRVEAGQVDCQSPACLMPIKRILPGQAWDLGHTPDRTKWRGPEHALCNRSEGGKAAHPA